jgi:hypothetical protein
MLRFIVTFKSGFILTRVVEWPYPVPSILLSSLFWAGDVAAVDIEAA